MHDPVEMPQRLASFLTAQGDGRTATVHTYEAMVGGYSRLMACAEVEWSDGERQTLVLRGDPPAGKAMMETDRHAEYRLLRALGEVGAVVMPAARHFDPSGEHLGTTCIVLDHVAGSPLQTILQQAPVDAHHAHADALVDTLAQIHAVDVDALGDALARPDSWDGYIGGLIDRFRLADRDHVESVPFLRFVAAWLDAHRPPPLPLRLVHSDFQPANIMVDPTGTHYVIDWELTHIGDPREDLGYYNVYSSALGPNLFMADPERFLARYRERTGFSEDAVNMQTMAYFSSLAAITVYAQILRGAGAMAQGLNGGLMTTYTHQRTHGRPRQLHGRLHDRHHRGARLMLSRPTTQQILLDCRAELLATIDAALTDPAAKVAVQMMENVLRNCAERAAHEIAWMHDESAAAISFAERVQASQPDRCTARRDRRLPQRTFRQPAPRRRRGHLSPGR